MSKLHNPILQHDIFLYHVVFFLSLIVIIQSKTDDHDWRIVFSIILVPILENPEPNTR